MVENTEETQKTQIYLKTRQKLFTEEFDFYAIRKNIQIPMSAMRKKNRPTTK